MWKWLEQFFTFTRNEKTGILLLIFTCVIVLLFPKVYLYFKPVETVSNSIAEKEVEEFIAAYNLRKQQDDSGKVSKDFPGERFNPYANIELSPRFESKRIEYFEFDPNKIGVEEWKRLGFSEKQAESIEKLKATGRKFYKPDDLISVYVIGEKHYDRLRPYIKIDPNNLPNKEFTRTPFPITPKEKFTVDINTADSSLFERQKGIGPSLASRIIKYRTRLGGFIAVEQIKEVWGMPDSTYQSLKDRFIINQIPISKVSVNKADIATMGKHPYINFTVAKVIDAYRKQHGNFKTIEDLKKVALVSDSIYRKMEPYVSVE